MRWQQIDTMTCSLARTLSVVGDRWTILILRDVFLGIRRFDAIQQDLQLTSHRLSDRLRKLVHDGVLRRVVYEDHPRRFEYRLTEKGFDLYPSIATMTERGDRWMAARAGVPVELVHQPCGHKINPKLVCPRCNLKIDARDMSARPGPALKGRAMPGHDTASQRRKVARETKKTCAPQKHFALGMKPR
jgi:DNA-binding HxlR family transcriptional regulator